MIELYMGRSLLFLPKRINLIKEDKVAITVAVRITEEFHFLISVKRRRQVETEHAEQSDDTDGRGSR